MKLNIQYFGGRGATSSSDTPPKKATFTTAIYNADRGGRQNVEVNGVSYRYKGIEVGVYGRTQNESQDIRVPGRGGDNYVAVVLSNNDANGLMIETGKTRKEAIAKANDLIDRRKKEILRAMGRAK